MKEVIDVELTYVSGGGCSAINLASCNNVGGAGTVGWWGCIIARCPILLAALEES